MVQTIGSIPFGTQLDWLWAELQGPEKKTWQNFLTNPNLITPAEYATAFEKTYERADGQHLESDRIMLQMYSRLLVITTCRQYRQMRLLQLII